MADKVIVFEAVAFLKVPNCAAGKSLLIVLCARSMNQSKLLSLTFISLSLTFGSLSWECGLVSCIVSAWMCRLCTMKVHQLWPFWCHWEACSQDFVFQILNFVQDLMTHRAEIHSKLVGIMRERLIASLTQLPALAQRWTAASPHTTAPSAFATSLAKQLHTLSQVSNMWSYAWSYIHLLV